MSLEHYVGFDIGSEFLHTAVTNPEGEISEVLDSRMHFGNPAARIQENLKELKSKGVTEDNSSFSFTGSGGQTFASITNTDFFFETVTIPTGAHTLCPEARYIFHIGAKDPYFFEKDSVESNGQRKVIITDNGTGTKCGGGSGILINKTVRRFFSEDFSSAQDLQEGMELMYKKAYEEALQADKGIDVGGRCGVVIQSDMIHLQNAGEKISNILMGMFERVAKNYKNDVIRMRQLTKQEKGLATGGVSSNALIVESLQKNIGVEVHRPQHYKSVGAIGATIKSLESTAQTGINTNGLEKAIEAEKAKIRYAPALSSGLDKVTVYKEPIKSERTEDTAYYPSNLDQNKTKVVLGVDGGSTTTKAVLLRSDNLTPIAEAITPTYGKPLEAIQALFGQIEKRIGPRIEIEGVAYTGSAGAFYQRLFTKPLTKGATSSDIVKDEITCHALGANHYKEGIDTIFELGGQDAKFTSFNEDDTVSKSKMNLSCMAGTGQTMENMMKMIGLNYNSFESAALQAERTPIVDDTCGVFTEAGISKLISLGLPKSEIAAAISYGFIGGYANKFVGNEPIGNCISAQGGPFNNQANLAALAIHTGKEINAFPHRQLFGAYGAAIAAHQNLQEIRGENNDKN